MGHDRMGPPVNSQEQLNSAFARLPTITGRATGFGGHVHPPGDQADAPRNNNNNRTGSSTEPEDKRNKIFSLNPFKAKKTKGGQPPKKRGPKPDSRPAATRRQELNRQAQRTHRERKELYTKQIESELVRLKEFVAQAAREADSTKHENERLKQLLRVNGIPFEYLVQQGDSPPGPAIAQTGGGGAGSNSNSNVTFDFNSQPVPTPCHGPYGGGGGGPHSVGTPAPYTTASSQGYSSRSASHDPSVSPPPGAPPGSAGFPPRKSSVASAGQTASHTSHTSPANTATMNAYNPPPSDPFLGVRGTPSQDDASVPHPINNLDPDQIGIDFVLALEQNCHDHKTFMTARTFNGEPEGLGGHALMLTCPPVNHLVHSPDTPYPHQLPDTSKAGLLNLMNISASLPVQGGEITPALAWKVIRQDQRFHFLSLPDFENLTTELKMRCRCYGWGAVVEKFEVHDVLDKVLQVKSELGV